MMSTISHSLNRRLLNWSLAASAAVGIVACLPSKTMAITITGFTGSYAPSNWTPQANINTNANGSIDLINSASGTIDLTGGDNGTSSSGNTDWTTTISQTSTIVFDWTFFTVDTPSGDDSAGYLLNGNFTELINNKGSNTIPDGTGVPSTSPVTVFVNSGDIFGFRVATTTNAGGAATFQVNNFDAQPTPVPFESDASAIIVSAGTLFVVYQWRKKRILVKSQK
ncbi:MAG: hypothetical protein ACKPCK_10470 [Dolichospermum sp.]